MIVLSLLVAALVMGVAAFVERRLGASAAGWVAALPVAFAVALVAVTIDAGERVAAALALSAATQVPAQVLFGVVFAAVLVRGGLMLGVLAGIVAYAACSAAVMGMPAAFVVAAAFPVLALAPRLIPAGAPQAVSPRRRSATALTCLAAPAIVGAAVLMTRVTGPEAAGAVAAFPTMCTALAVAVATRDGPPAGARALTGLVRSLPCYLAFCLVVALAAQAAGPAAVALGLLACAAAACATWRAEPALRAP